MLQILEDLQDVTVVEHCLDIISWLEEHTTLLSSQAYKTGQQQVRLCAAIAALCTLADCTCPLDCTRVAAMAW